MIIPLENRQKTWTGILLKSVYKLWSCSILLVSRERQIKTKISLQYLSEWLKWKVVITPNASGDPEKLDHSCIFGGTIIWYTHSVT